MTNQGDSTTPTPLTEAVEDARAEGFKVSPDPAGGYLARMEPKLGCGPFFVYVILGGAMVLTAFFYWASLIVAAFIGLAAYFWSGQGETFSISEAPDGAVEWAVRRNRNGTYKWIAWAGAVIAFIGFALTYPSTGSDIPSRDIARGDLGDKWPLTVDAGVLSCDTFGRVMFEVDGTTYAVNGTAQDKYQAIDAIWANSPSDSSMKINISPLIAAGRAICP